MSNVDNIFKQISKQIYSDCQSITLKKELIKPTASSRDIKNALDNLKEFNSTELNKFEYYITRVSHMGNYYLILTKINNTIYEVIFYIDKNNKSIIYGYDKY
jgi:hypothetical protein